MTEVTKLPCAEQTPETTKTWMKEYAVNRTVVAVRNTQGGITAYKLDVVDSINPKTGRIYTEQYGAFYYSGKNCFHPKGQTWVLVPTNAILDAIDAGKIWMFG